VSLSAWERAKDARAAYAEKYGTANVHDASTFVEDFIKVPDSANQERALDSFRFVCAAWNVAVPEDEEDECETCGSTLDPDSGEEPPLCNSCIEDDE
jgi:hypothetical protein